MIDPDAPADDDWSGTSGVDRVVAFLRGIGVEVVVGPIDEPTVLPGVTLDHGALLVDPTAVIAAGDLLHEAGHVAVTPAGERPALHRNAGSDGGMEMGAIAWSYAAARHVGMPVGELFHDRGYLGGARALADGFESGRSVGVPVLAWRGLTTVEAYPAMDRWLA